MNELDKVKVPDTPTNSISDNTESVLSRAAVCIRQGDDAAAEKLIQTVLAVQPALIDGYAQLGGICRELKQWERARVWMERDYANGRMSLGWQLRYADVLAELGHMSEAKEIVESAYQKDPNATDGYARLAGVFMRRKEWRTARQWMQRDVETGRISPVWQVHYAAVLAELGQMSEAQEIVETAYQQDPNVTDGFARLGAVFMRRNEWDVARKWMERDIESKRISPLWRVYYARLLGAFGEISEAEDVLHAVKSGNTTGRRLPIEVFLEACEVFFFLHPHQGASKLLNDGLASYPQQTAVILAKMADIKQRAAINKWLSSKSKQAAAKTVADNHGSDSTSSIMPDWFDVVSAYDRALAAGSDIEKSDGLRKMTLARLFCVEALREVDDQNGSTAALHDCLQAINPSMSKEQLRPVAESIAAYQNGRETKDGATQRINLEVENSHTLSSKQWLALNDVLIWHGFFRSGYRAWDNSIRQAYIEAETHRGDLSILLHGYRAAMIVADYDRAAIYLNYLRQIDEREYRDANAYLCLHQSRIEEALAHWQLQNGTRDRRFHEYIKGKSVAIAGPAPTGELCGEEIDSFDIVLRTCYTGEGFDQAEFGNRTTASNYPDWCVREWGVHANRSYLADLEWYSFGHITSLCAALMRDLQCRKAYKIFPNTQFYFKYPNAIQRIIFDTLRFSHARIKLFKSNFFLTRNTYSAEYYRPDYTPAGKEGVNNALPFRQSVLFGHDFICQLAFVRNLWEAGVIEVDNACRQVLELTNEQYMERMETLHGG